MNMAEVNKVNLRLLVKLIESGITTEKAVTSLKLKDIISIPDISKQELSAVCDLQDAIKAGSVMGFLTKSSESSEESANDEA
jgi:rRNA processing protein Krr1/Pno1